MLQDVVIRALDFKPEELALSPESACSELCDLRQVTQPLWDCYLMSEMRELN